MELDDVCLVVLKVKKKKLNNMPLSRNHDLVRELSPQFFWEEKLLLCIFKRYLCGFIFVSQWRINGHSKNKTL